MKKTVDIESILHFEHLKEEFKPGCPYIKSIRCRICNDTLYDALSVQGPRVNGDFNGLISQIKVHFKLNHNIEIVHHSCDDSKCLQNP